MSEIIKFKNECLNELVTLKRGIVLSKSYIQDHKGIYPVYSSQTKNDGILGYIDTYSFDGEYITWTTDGVNAGTTFYRNGKFNCTNVCGVMALNEKYKNISLEYINCCLNLKKIAKSSGNKKVMSDDIIRAKLTVPIPIDSNGIFDLEKQKELAQKYKEIEEKKKILLDKIEILKTNKIILENDANGYRQVSINELFTPKNGNALYTKEWCQNHLGDVPLYSGNTVGTFASIDKADYDGEYITWAKDGLAGKIMYHNGKFSITGHRGILIPTDKCKNIDLKYIKWIIEPIFRKNIKGRIGVNGKNEYTTLNSVMIKSIKEKIDIPIKADGSYDLEKQKELAQKYATIESIKQNLYTQIKELTAIVVS